MKLHHTPFLSFFFCVFSFAIFSCSIDPNPQDCCTIIDTDVQIHYQTQTGDDLINSSQEFNQANIKIYYLVGGEFEYVYNNNLDNPGYFDVYKDQNDRQILRIFPSNNYDGDFSTTLIELNESVIDTLYCEFELTNSSEICKKVWLNGEEYDNRYLEIMK